MVPMKIEGNWFSRQVWVDDQELTPERSQKVFNHSPDGFNWGYEGSGPAQLALAILLLVTDEQTAVKFHQKFKRDFVAGWPQSHFGGHVEIEGWLKRSQSESII